MYFLLNMGDIPASYLRLPRGYHFKVKKRKTSDQQDGATKRWRAGRQHVSPVFPIRAKSWRWSRWWSDLRVFQESKQLMERLVMLMNILRWSDFCWYDITNDVTYGGLHLIYTGNYMLIDQTIIANVPLPKESKVAFFLLVLDILKPW